MEPKRTCLNCGNGYTGCAGCTGASKWEPMDKVPGDKQLARMEKESGKTSKNDV